MDSGEIQMVSATFSNYLLHRYNQQISGTTSNYKDDDTISATELDSHADSPVVGKYCTVLEDTGRNARVSGFTSELSHI